MFQQKCRAFMCFRRVTGDPGNGGRLGRREAGGRTGQSLQVREEEEDHRRPGSWSFQRPGTHERVFQGARSSGSPGQDSPLGARGWRLQSLH